MKGILKWNKNKGFTFKQRISHKQEHWKNMTNKRAVYINKTQFKCYWWCFDKTHCYDRWPKYRLLLLYNLNKWRMSCSNLPLGASLWSLANQWVHCMNERCALVWVWVNERCSLVWVWVNERWIFSVHLCAVSPLSPHLGCVGWPSPDQIPPDLSLHTVIK